jgi:transposase
MTKFPEVISTVQRRRGWGVEEKVAILDAAFAKGGLVAAAADRFGVSRSLIYIWRRQMRDGLMPGVTLTAAGVSAFAVVAVAPEPAQAALPLAPPLSASADKPCRAQPCVAPTCAASLMRPSRRSGAVEVRLVNGRTVKVDESIALAFLARLIAALDGELR